MLRRISLILFVGLAVAGCDLSPPDDAIEFAKNYIALFRTHNFAEIQKRSDPAIQNAQFRTNIEKMATVIPNEDPKEITVVGWNKNSKDGKLVNVRMSFQYEFSKVWLVATILVVKKGDDFLIRSATFTPHADSLQNLSKFTFSGKPLTSYLFLIYAIALPIFMIFTAVVAYRTPIPKRKWLWVLFTLVGLFQVTLNWTTGIFSINVAWFQILGSGYSSGLYSPVLIVTSFPLGAALFFERRRHWLRQAAAASAVPPTAAAGS